MTEEKKKRTPSQIGTANRRNGGKGERLVVNELKQLWYRISRDLNDVYKKEGIDLLNSGHTAETGVAVQVKYYAKHTTLGTKYKEIQPKDSRIPILVSWPRLKKNGEPLVVLSLEDFIRIAKDPNLLELEPENEEEFKMTDNLKSDTTTKTASTSDATLEFAKVLGEFHKQLIFQNIDSATVSNLMSNFQVFLMDEGFFSTQ